MRAGCRQGNPFADKYAPCSDESELAFVESSSKPLKSRCSVLRVFFGFLRNFLRVFMGFLRKFTGFLRLTVFLRVFCSPFTPQKPGFEWIWACWAESGQKWAGSHCNCRSSTRTGPKPAKWLGSNSIQETRCFSTHPESANCCFRADTSPLILGLRRTKGHQNPDFCKHQMP